MMDIPKHERELYAAFVVTSVGNATIADIDESEALVKNIFH